MGGECTEQQRNLDATHDVTARGRLAAEIANWCDLNMREVQLAYHGKSDEYWRTYGLWFGEYPANATEREIEDQVREARFYSFGRLAFLLVESLAAAVLAVMFFNAPWPLGAAIGVMLALLLGAAAASGVARWIRHEAAMQPAKQLARVSRGFLWFVIPWLVAVVAALAILRSDASRLGATLFLVMTTAVTLLSPPCSGLCAYAADLLFWSKRLCTDLRWLRALGRRIHRLSSVCTRCLNPATPKVVKTEDRTLRLIKSAAPTLVIAATVAGVLGCAPEIRAAEVPVYVYPDVSPSVRTAEVHHVLKELSLRLEQYEGANPLAISVIPFYEDVYSAVPLIRIRIPSTASPACDGPVPQTEIGRLSKTYASSAKREADAKCDAARDAALAAAHRQRDAEIAKFNAAIDHLGDLRIIGRCTAVNAMIRRAAAETPAGISILISDLENDCPPYTLTVPSEPGNRLFVIPVGSRTRPVEQWFDSAQARFAQRMPAARLVEPFNLDVVFRVILGVRGEMAERH